MIGMRITHFKIYLEDIYAIIFTDRIIVFIKLIQFAISERIYSTHCCTRESVILSNTAFVDLILLTGLP